MKNAIKFKGMKKSSTDHHLAARGPGDVQEGSLRAEKILNDESNDNLEQSATNDFESLRGSVQHSKMNDLKRDLLPLVT